MAETESIAVETPVVPDYRPILRRASYLLLIVGLIDIGWTAYNITPNTPVTFNLVAIAGGLLLLWGGLRIASAIRWLTVLVLSSYLAGTLLAPFVQPWDLTRVQLRLTPPEVIAYSLIYPTLCIALMLWLAWVLGKPAIHAARAAAGRPRRDMRIPAALGASSMLVIFVMTFIWLNGEAAKKAVSMAEQEMGPGYHYRVGAMQQSTQSVTAIVTAWNDEQVRNIPIRWEKP